MVKRSQKSLSKRVTLKQKYNIKRKIRDANRHERRAERALGRRSTSTKATLLRKDPGVPNLFPYKKQIIADMMKANGMDPLKIEKELAVTETKRRLENAAQLQASAQIASNTVLEYENNNPSSNENNTGLLPGETELNTFERERHVRRGAFRAELERVIDGSDIIIEVVDARDPLGTRSEELEQRVLQKKKPFILLLNKIDLIPEDVAIQWLKFFKKIKVPACVFRAAENGANVQRANLVTANARGKNASVGIEELKRTITSIYNGANNANGSTAGDANGRKSRIVAGIVGIPNVGKSSVINSLAGRKAVGVAPIPGFTKTMSEIDITNHLRILDSPGVVLQTGKKEESLNTLMREEQLVDPIGEVTRIFYLVKNFNEVTSAFGINLDQVMQTAETYSGVKIVEKYFFNEEAISGFWNVISKTYDDEAKQMMNTDDLNMMKEAEELLSHIVRAFLIVLARQMGKILKGGIADIDSAAKFIIREWNRGKVPFYVSPPIENIENNATLPTVTVEKIIGNENEQKIKTKESVHLLSELGQAFDIDSLFTTSLNLVSNSLQENKKFVRLEK